MNLRIGQGFDVHRLENNKNFILGGVKIPHYKGALAHSDGDVLIHAICDALLGAANLGDIGKHFPDSSEKYKGIDSKILLAETNLMINNKGYIINNIDCTVCLEKPKISEYIELMQIEISNTLQISKEQVSIKATTNEKLGYVGNEEGVWAQAVVLLIKN